MLRFLLSRHPDASTSDLVFVQRRLLLITRTAAPPSLILPPIARILVVPSSRHLQKSERDSGSQRRADPEKRETLIERKPQTGLYVTAQNGRDDAGGAADAIYRSDSRQIFAMLVRLLGDSDLAEAALHEAFTAALEQWRRDGVPANPRAWLVSTGCFKASDAIRRRAL